MVQFRVWGLCILINTLLLSLLRLLQILFLPIMLFVLIFIFRNIISIFPTVDISHKNTTKIITIG